MKQQFLTASDKKNSILKNKIIVLFINFSGALILGVCCV